MRRILSAALMLAAASTASAQTSGPSTTGGIPSLDGVWQDLYRTSVGPKLDDALARNDLAEVGRIMKTENKTPPGVRFSLSWLQHHIVNGDTCGSPSNTRSSNGISA